MRRRTTPAKVAAFAFQSNAPRVCFSFRCSGVGERQDGGRIWREGRRSTGVHGAALSVLTVIHYCHHILYENKRGVRRRRRIPASLNGCKLLLYYV